MISAKDFWNRRSLIYDSQVGPHYEEAYRKTAEKTLRYLRAEDHVLEFACGTGIVTAAVAPHVAQIRAIDISDRMVQLAAEKIRRSQIRNVTVEQLDLFDPSLPEGSFDAVMAFNVLCYVENRGEVLARIRRLLKPNGMFLSATDCLGQKITAVGLRKWWRSHTGKMPYVAFDSMEHLKHDIAKAGFSVLESENLFFSPPNLFVAAQKKR